MRWYRTPEGLVVPSVSTVLGVLPKPGLPMWYAKKAAEAAVTLFPGVKSDGREGYERQWIDDAGAEPVWMNEEAAIRWIKRAPERARDYAANRGTDVHEAAQTGDWSKVPEYELSYRNFEADYEPLWIAREAEVWGRRWAGRLDAVAVFPDLGWGVIDLKTTGVIRESVGPQLAAYGEAWALSRWDDIGETLDFGLAVRLSADGTYEARSYDLLENVEIFLSALHLFHWCMNNGVYWDSDKPNERNTVIIGG